MPKLLVLFDPRSPDMAALADAIAEGARLVRFAEVDVRCVSHTMPDGISATRHRTLESADALATYDGVVIGAFSAETKGDGVVDSLSAATTSLVDKVGSVFTTARADAERSAVLWSVLAAMADRGMILVPPRVNGLPSDELSSAREQGKRVADVVGWVTHARSHHHHH
ncbi:MAG: hypothetical protein ABI601_05860 [bacterium]